MTFEHIEHEADVGVKGIGDTLEEAFAEGARAMFDIMIDLAAVEPLQSVSIECDAESIETLFVEWLNALLAQINIAGMFFSKFDVEIEQAEGSYKLHGTALGEPIDQEKHQAKIEVKAATFSGLKHEEVEGKHYIQCVVDV